MKAPADRHLRVLLVDPSTRVSPDTLEQMSAARMILHRVASPAAAGRFIDQSDVDLVVAVLPEPGADQRSTPGEPTHAITTLLRELLERRGLQAPLFVADDESDLSIDRHAARSSHPSFRGMIGHTPAIRAMQRTIERVAASERPVLVVGPTGTGKELAVEAIHRLGRHPEAPLIDLNCGAIPEMLMESMLFGHARGAFTGAEQAQEGYLAAVGKGTLFLDEVAEMPLPLQAKLLRALETRKYRRVGSTEERTFHGRIVAATHADLLARARDRRFREDLYYRLAVLTVEVPALAQRRDDIPALVEHFARRQERPLRFTAAALEQLRESEWPGNIRQLRNYIDALAVTAESDPIDVDSLRGLLRGEPRESASISGSLRDLAAALLGSGGGDKLAAVQDLMIDAAMREHGGNKSAAARALGVHRKVLERRLGRDDGAQQGELVERETH